MVAERRLCRITWSVAVLPAPCAVPAGNLCQAAAVRAVQDGAVLGIQVPGEALPGAQGGRGRLPGPSRLLSAASYGGTGEPRNAYTYGKIGAWKGALATRTATTRARAPPRAAVLPPRPGPLLPLPVAITCCHHTAPATLSPARACRPPFPLSPPRWHPSLLLHFAPFSLSLPLPPSLPFLQPGCKLQAKPGARRTHSVTLSWLAASLPGRFMVCRGYAGYGYARASFILHTS